MYKPPTLAGEIKPASPLQVHNYWATARQNLALLHRAKTPESTIDNVRQEYADILESSILNYPPTLKLLGLEPEFSFLEKKAALGIAGMQPEYTDNQRKLLKRLKDSQDETRKANWKWRISQEIEEKQRLGWYPFFVTLTVNPDWTDPERLWKEGREFRKYIRRLSKVVTKELGHPPAHKKPYRPESDYITYVGVIEHGKSREHHHAHFLIWLREIPSKWKTCPNKYIRNPANRQNRECISMRTYWKWSLPGLSKAYYFRTKGDRWHALGHCIPIDPKTQKPVYIAGARQSGAYVTKYIQKDHKQWKHRVKATRNLGMKTLKETISKLQIQIVEALSWRPHNYSQHHLANMTHSVPLGLVRLVAKQVHWQKKLEQESLDFQSVMINNSGTFTKMLRSSLRGQRPDRMCSKEFYDWVCQFLPVQRGYCEKRHLVSNQRLGIAFPRQRFKVDPLTQAGNRYEFA